MAVIVAISRLGGTEIMGGYSFIVSFVGIFGLISQMGLQTLITREVAANRKESSSFLYGALFLGLFSSLLLAAAMNLSKSWFKLAPDVSLGITLISLNLFPMFAIAVFDAVFMGLERPDLTIYQNLAGNLVRVGLSLFLVWYRLDLRFLVAAIIISTLVSVTICIATYFTCISRITFKFNLNVSLRLLRSSPTFLLITLVWIAWARLDTLMLTKLANMTQVALYVAAYKLFEPTMIVPQSYIKASFPHLSSLQRINPALFQKANRDMLGHMLLYVFPVTALVMVLSPAIIQLLYGSQFSISAATLRILILGLIPWAMGRTIANMIVASNLQRYDLYSVSFAALTSVLLNIFAIPRYGAEGAAFAGLASFSAFFMCQFALAKKAGFTILLHKAIVRPIILGLIFLGGAWFASLGWFCIISEALLLICIGAICFRESHNREYLKKALYLLHQVIKA